MELFGVPLKRLGTELYDAINDDNVLNGAGAISYFLSLAIFPAAIFLLSILPYLPISNLKDEILNSLDQIMPGESARLFRSIVETAVSQRRGGLLSFGFFFALWSASSGLAAVMQQLNVTYNVKEGRSFLKSRGMAIFLTVLFVGLVIGAFGLIIFGGIFQGKITAFMGQSAAFAVLFLAFRWLVILALLVLGFEFVYYYGPDVEQKFRFISPGSALAALLLIAASFGFRYYIANFGNYSATYGSIGAIIVLMLWLYIAGLVTLLGAEVNAIYEHHHPSGKKKGDKEFHDGDSH